MSYGKASVEQYRKSAVNSASPLQLVVMLYDGALRFMEAAKHSIEHGELYKQNENCKKAQNIISELMSTLNMEQGGEIAQNLFSLYTFAYDKLIEGNVNDNPKSISEAIEVMSQLRESWVQLEKMTSQPNTNEVQHAA